MAQNDEKSMKHRSTELIGQLGYNYKDFSRKCQEKQKRIAKNRLKMGEWRNSQGRKKWAAGMLTGRKIATRPVMQLENPNPTQPDPDPNF